MMSIPEIGLVGISGMGEVHLRIIRQMENEGRAKLVSVCDKYLKSYIGNIAKYNFESVKQYDDFSFMLKSGDKLDLLIISTPIHLHKSMLCDALSAGYDVLLEKPPAVTIQDIDEMIRTEESSGHFCAVAFQHTAEQSFVCLKQRLMKGEIGKIKSIAAQGIWKRDRGYFNRTPWAGKLKIGDQYVLDGTINNPFAHLLNNSLILAGLTGSSTPSTVCAELYRANNIESEDTSCLKILTTSGAEVFFASTIAAYTEETPYIFVEGSSGNAYWDYDGNIRLFHKNETNPYESLTVKSNAEVDLYHNVLDFMTGKSNSVCCSLKSTRDFVLSSNLAFRSSRTIHNIDKTHLSHIGTGESEVIAIHQINELIHSAVKEKKLFSACGAEWGARTSPASAEGYAYFELEM